MHGHQFNQHHQQYHQQPMQVAAKNERAGVGSASAQAMSHAQQQAAQLNYKMQHANVKLTQKTSSANAKQLAMNGATGLTGRKGSMPENLMAPLSQLLQSQSHQGSGGYLNPQLHSQQRGSSYGNKQIQRSKQAAQYSQALHTSQAMHGPGKLIKSHAKYFSQQNSPVNRQNGQQVKASTGLGQGPNYTLNNPQIQKQHQKHLAYQQQYLAQKQATQTGMGTIAGAMDQSQQQFMAQQAKYQGHVEQSLHNTLDIENLNTIGASSTVAQNMENDYSVNAEYQQYRQGLDQRRHSHQGVNRQQQQYRQSFYDPNQSNLINHAVHVNPQYGQHQQMLAYNQGPVSLQMSQMSKQASKQKMGVQKNAAGEYQQQRANDNQYRTNIQAQMLPDGTQTFDQQYVSLPQQPNQEYIKKYHSQNQGPVLSNTAQNQTVVTTTNNSFIVSQTLSHGPQNSNSQYKNAKQKYEDSFLNQSMNNASNAAINDSSIMLNNSQILAAEGLHDRSMSINQTIHAKNQGSFSQSKRQSHNNSVIHQPHHHQMPARVGYDQKNYGQVNSNQHSMVAHKAQKRSANSQMAMYNDQQKYANGDQMKSVKKVAQKSTELSAYRYKNTSSQMNNQQNVRHQHSQLSMAQHQRSVSGSGLSQNFQLKSNTKRPSKAQTRPVSNKKSQQQTMVQQQSTAFGDHMQSAIGVAAHAHMGDNSMIIRNKHAVSQSANNEMHQHASLQPGQAPNNLREKKKSTESTHSQSMIQYKKTAMPIATVPSQPKLQSGSGLHNHSESVLVGQHGKSASNSGMPSHVGRSKAGQAQTAKTSPHKQHGPQLDGSIIINMLHTNSTSQKMSDFKKGYQQNTFMHQPNTNPTQQTIHQDQSSITLMPNQMLSKQSQQRHQNTHDQRTNYTQYSNDAQKSKIKKTSSELNFYQKRMPQHQQIGKQRTASNTSTSSYQKMPLVSASSNSRHSQKRKDGTGSGHHASKFGAQDHEMASSEKRNALELDAAQQRAKGQTPGQKQISKKNNSITIQRSGHHINEIVVAQNDERMIFENMEAARNYSATQRQQFIDQQHRGQQDANLHRNVLINKSISMNQIQPQLDRKMSQDLVNNSMYARPTMVQYPEQKGPPQAFIASQMQQIHGGIEVQNQMMGINRALHDLDPAEHHKGSSERHTIDNHHAKSLNLNDSSNIHVEDSLREAIAPQNSKNTLANSVNYGISRPSGSSKSQVGRSSKIAGTTKPQSSKLTEQSQKTGQSQKNIRKHSSGGDGGSNKAGYAYQSQSSKSQMNTQHSKRLNQHSTSLSMSQMLIQKGINNRQASHSSAGFHQKHQHSVAMPSGSSQMDVNQTSNQQSNKFTQLMAANGLMFKAAHITIKGAHTTSANTAVNTAKNSPRVVQTKSKSIHSGGGNNKSHSSIGLAQNNNLTHQRSIQISDKQRDANSKGYHSGHSSKQHLGGAPHTVKPKSQQKQKNFGNLIDQSQAAKNYQISVAKQQAQLSGLHGQNLNTISNYHQPQEQLQKQQLAAQFRQPTSNSQQNLSHPVANQVHLSVQQSEILQNPALNAPEQHHQWYQPHNGTESQQNRLVKPHQLMDGGTGSVSKLENSQDQIDSFQQQSSKQQKSKKIEKKTQNILKNAKRTAQILQHDQDPQLVEQPDPAPFELPDGPLITEEDEAEIRQVASDINEKAFFGKVLRTKSIIEKHSQRHDQFDLQIQKLSPRSQEIAFVMKKINESFSQKGEAPETTLDFYRIGKMLGRGAFGKVNLAMQKLVRKLVALKSLNKECLTDEVQKQKLMKEVNLLLKLRHDNVVKIYETIETKKHIIIVMELCAGGDLLNYVRKRRRLKEPLAKKIFKQIIDGLKYIHSKYVAHRDIKLDNILLDGKGQVKIADFGVSKQTSPGVKMREQCGTPAYIAPEILRNKNGYTFGVDLWSAGVVLYAMLYGTVPFKAASMDELHSLILRGVYTLKDDISQEARDMLRGLLDINPHKRFNYDQINSHPWLADLDPTLQLFNQQEREMIKKEYTYNDPSRYNRNENEEPADCFTEHNIDSVYTLKNCSEKSVILAPFNSTQSEDIEVFKKRIKPMMLDKNLVLRLSRLCREVDRQYEFNNNGQLDNGVYHKQLNNSAEDAQKDDKTKEKKKDKKDKKKDQESSEDDELKFQVMQCSRSQGRDFLTEECEELPDFKTQKQDFRNSMLANMTEAERRLVESTFGTNQEMELDEVKINNMVQYGYPKEYIVKCLQDNSPNYTTAGYYLLKMDQNYC